MNKITFGVKTKVGYERKLCVCEETKQIEFGQCLINHDYVDIYVLNEKELKKLKEHYLNIGYTETNEVFAKEEV